MSTAVSRLKVSQSSVTCEMYGDYTLSFEGMAPVSDNDQLLDDVRQLTKDVRPDWYNLAIELDIDYGTRKVRLIGLFCGV